MIIREANVTEIGIIADFQVKMAWETEEFELNLDIVTKGVSAVFDDCTKGKFYVAESDNKVVASLLTTFEWSDWRNKYVLWIQSVYVLPEFRKLGIFSQMYSFIKEIVKNNSDFSGIRLYVDKTNVKAQKVYEKVGMNGNHYQLFEEMF